MKTRLLQSLYVVLGVLGFIFIPIYLGVFVNSFTFEEEINSFGHWILGLISLFGVFCAIIAFLYIVTLTYCWIKWLRTGEWDNILGI